MNIAITKKYADQIGIKKGDNVCMHIKYKKENGVKKRFVFFEKHPSGYEVKIIKEKWIKPFDNELTI